MTVALAKLIANSAGNVMTEITLAAICHFKKIEEAVKTVIEIVTSGIPVAKCEYLDDTSIQALNQYSNFHMPISHTLLLELHGPGCSVHQQYKEFMILAGLNNGFSIQGEGEDTQKLRKTRHEMLYTVTALVPGIKPYTRDVCVPVTKLAEIIVKTRKCIDEEELIGPILGHVGGGNFHVFSPIVPKDYVTLKKVSGVARKIALLSLELNGTCSDEHGIGQGKRDFLVKEVVEEGVTAMRQIKQTFDPNDILNPGKILFR